MAEFMRHHGLELAYIDAIDQTQANLQILSDGQKHAPETGIIKDTGVDVGAEIDLLGEAGNGSRRQLPDKSKKLRLIFFEHFHPLGVLVLGYGKDEFYEENQH